MAVSLGRDSIILTVNQRLARHLLFKHSQQKKKSKKNAWVTPKIFEINSWFKSKWFNTNSDHFLLSQIQSTKIWESIIKEFPGNEQTTDRKRIINQWNLLNLRSAAQKASDAYKLITEHRISIPTDPIFLNKENILFSKWMDQYKLFLLKEKAIDPVTLMDIVREEMKNNNIYIPNRVELCGFEDITPQLTVWLDFLKANKKEVTLKLSPRNSHSLSNKDVLTKSNIKVHSFNDFKSECRNCANWVRSIFNKGQTIGIIAPDLEKYRRPLYKELTSNLIPKSIFPGENIETPFEISLGTPVYNEGMIQVAIELLSIEINSPINKFLHIANSPYLSAGRNNYDNLAELEVNIQKEANHIINLESIDTFFSHGSTSEIKKLLNILIDLTRITHKQLPSSWVSFFSNLLKDLGWLLDLDKVFSSREIQCLSLWNECLNELASLDMIVGELPRHQIIQELKEITSKKIFQVKTKEHPIQVLSFFESTGIPFDNLWVLGCHSDCIPAQPNPNPFIPINLQKTLNLPHSNSKQELYYSERALNRLIDSSQNIIFSYPEWEQDNNKQITPLLRCFSKDKIEFNYTNTYRVRDFIKPLDQVELWEDKSTIIPSPKELEMFTINGVRSGYKVLQNQAACSFKAFAAHRLQANDFELSDIDYDSRERGILIHKVLQLFWEKHKTQSALQNLKSSNNLTTELKKKISEAMQQTNIRINNQYYFVAMEQSRILSLLLNWMEQELLRPKFEVKHIEKNTPINIGNLKVNLRVDRVDISPEGKNILIDYKTGLTNTNSWFKDRIQDPQLPLYTVKSSPTAIAFAKISKGNLKWKSLCDPSKDNPFTDKSSVKIPLKIEEEIGWPNWDNLLNFWEIKLSELADSFMEGEIITNPIKNDETCQNCTYGMLCRIGEKTSIENSLSDANE